MPDYSCGINRDVNPTLDDGPAIGDVGLSVAMCTHNGARWLRDQLDSLSAQTRQPDELVVCDDDSSDDTIQIVQAFAEEVNFPVRLKVNEKLLGSTRNFEAALRASRGRIVALADQDDVWHPQKLELLTWEFDQDPTISMVFSDALLIDDRGAELGSRLWDSRLVGRTLRGHAVVPEELFARRALTTGCTMAIRRRTLEAALPFPDLIDDPRALMRHDRWLSLVAAAVGTVRALREPLVSFRVHQDQETGVLSPGQLVLALTRSALRVAENATSSDEHMVRAASDEHMVRAAQLDAAAYRAEEVGDFHEAETLRRVADHRRARSAIGRAQRGPVNVLRSAVNGDYRGDPLSPLAIGSDVVRSVRRRPSGEAPTSGRQASPGSLSTS